MATPSEITAWDPPKGAMWAPMAFYGGLMTLGVLALLPIAWRWKVVLLVLGWTADAVIAQRLFAAVEYVLTDDSITRRSRGKSQTMPLADVTHVFGYFRNKVGDFICVQSREESFDLQLGAPDVSRLLERLGPLLVERGVDRRVIADEKARRWLGLPDGGLRDPWTAPTRDD